MEPSARLKDPHTNRVRSASVKDVAAAAGVSLGTVSNFLNRPDRVSPKTRDRVERAMRELNFVRNESARHLRAGRSNTIAYVMLDVSNPFFTDVAAGVEDRAAEADLSLFLCNSDNNADRELKYLRRLTEQRVQGILVTPTDAEAPILEEVAAHGTPLVVVDRVSRRSSLCSVAVDDELGGRLAIEHLVDRGHERIAFVGGPQTLGQVSDRLGGATQALSHAVPGGFLTVVDCSALTVAEGRRAGELIAGLPRNARPTAAFCANDLIALGLLQQCVGLGLGVPDDLAIVGYDDIDFAGSAAVPLTSVRQPRRQLGRTGIELLLDEGSNPDHQHRQVVFTPEIVARASTRALR